MRESITFGVIFLAACAGSAPARPAVARPGPVPKCEPEEGSGEPFNRGAAASNSSVDLSSCHRPGVEPADGRVEMIFCPGDGAVHSAAVIEDPFDDETRRCIEEKFLSVRVPPFSGKPVHVKRAVHLR